MVDWRTTRRFLIAHIAIFALVAYGFLATLTIAPGLAAASDPFGTGQVLCTAGGSADNPAPGDPLHRHGHCALCNTGACCPICPGTATFQPSAASFATSVILTAAVDRCTPSPRPDIPRARAPPHFI